MLASQVAVITEMETTSPSLAELARLCLLRAGLSRTEGLSGFVLGNPKAWLGSAYHEVLGKISTVDLTSDTVDAVFERLWHQAVKARHRRARCHPLDQRFGTPSNWPGYYLIRAGARLRVQKILAEQPRSVRRDASHHWPSTPTEVRERRFIACADKLVGRPDLVRGDAIVDYKTGQIFEDGENGQWGRVKASYLRQLRIYAYLIQQNLGIWPRLGVIVPLTGDAFEIELHPVECEHEALEAVKLLDSYNEILHAWQDPNMLASPSCEACNWCSYKIVCPAFWQNASIHWPKMASGVSVKGTLLNSPQPVHGGAAYSLSMDVHAGTEGNCRIDVMPLNSSVHSSLSTVSAGETVRLTGLRLRQDGTLIPTQRTILVPERKIPLLQVTTCKRDTEVTVAT